MPSEPLEAEFSFPPALSSAQDDEYRELAHEGPLSLTKSAGGSTLNVAEPTTVKDLEAAYEHRGIHIVEFEKGAGEDPREWGKARKW